MLITLLSFESLVTLATVSRSNIKCPSERLESCVPAAAHEHVASTRGGYYQCDISNPSKQVFYVVLRSETPRRRFRDAGKTFRCVQRRPSQRVRRLRERLLADKRPLFTGRSHRIKTRGKDHKLVAYNINAGSCLLAFPLSASRFTL